MTWKNRIGLLFGLLLVVAVVAAGTVILNQRQGRAVSATASIVAETYPVGTAYGGNVTRQFVSEGDTVKRGDPLFTIHSTQLERDLEDELVDLREPGVGEDGDYTVAATVDGTVASLAVTQGGFAGSGVVVAELEKAGTLTVSAEFTLSARDFGRIEDAARVDLQLPDQRVLSGAVDVITVTTIDGNAVATASVVSEELAADAETGIVQSGTPVVATLHLRDDGPFAGVADMAKDFVNRVGL